jgi:XTP/dITP diphosphohydrolase
MEVIEVLFATSNQNKVAEANKVGQDFGVSFRQINVMYPEVRADSVRAVAEEGMRYVHSQINRPIIVEDSGLFIDALNGFPGAYSAFVFGKIGCDGILKLMDGVEDRKARFVSAIGYKTDDEEQIFEGASDGFITLEKRGRHGFGYDSIFQPADSNRTFAEDLKRKNEVSHRRKATEQLCRFLRPQ